MAGSLQITSWGCSATPPVLRTARRVCLGANAVPKTRNQHPDFLVIAGALDFGGASTQITMVPVYGSDLLASESVILSGSPSPPQPADQRAFCAHDVLTPKHRDAATTLTPYHIFQVATLLTSETPRRSASTRIPFSTTGSTRCGVIPRSDARVVLLRPCAPVVPH